MIDNLFLRLGIIYALILTGVVFKRLIKEVDSLIKNISFLLSNLLMPVAVFTSITQFSEAFNDFRIPLFSVFIFFLSFIVAFFVFKIIKRKGGSVGPFILASVNPNGFFLPFPIVLALYNVEGISYSTVYFFIANFVNAFCIYPLYSYYSNIYQKKGFSFIRSILFFPPFIASVLGFVFLSSGFLLPERLVQPAFYFGRLTTYLALLFVGLNINLEVKDWFSRPIFGVGIVRLLLSPLLVYSLIKFLGFKEVWSQVIIIHSGMPPAVNNIILADYFGLDRKLMAKIVTELTALTLLTLPLLIYLGESL